eukprot:6655249-Prymnesium_polylepis.2
MKVSPRQIGRSVILDGVADEGLEDAGGGRGYQHKGHSFAIAKWLDDALLNATAILGELPANKG